MDAIFQERRKLESELRRALTTNSFHLAYQPLFNFRDGSLIGFEALLRWPEGWTPQSPSSFIPIAEETGLIVPIGAWVLESACKAAASWTKPLKVAVNLSPVQFRHGDIVDVVEAALKISGRVFSLEGRPAFGFRRCGGGVWFLRRDRVLIGPLVVPTAAAVVGAADHGVDAIALRRLSPSLTWTAVAPEEVFTVRT